MRRPGRLGGRRRDTRHALPALATATRRAALRLASLAMMLMLGGCVQGLFFHPDNRDYGRPSALGLQGATDVYFKTADRSTLHGWWLPAAPQAGPPRCTVLHVHGNAANISNHLPLVAWLPAEGVNVMMFDYRGFGLSGGKPSLDGVVADTEAAIRAALAHSGSTPGRLVVLGQSLGGASAIRAVARSSAGQVQGLIVDAAFASYRDVAHDVAQQIKLLALLAPVLKRTLPDAEDDPVTAMPRLNVPVWVIHGEADDIISMTHGRRLFEAAREPRAWIPVPGAGHLESLMRDDVRRAVLGALEQACSGLS